MLVHNPHSCRDSAKNRPRVVLQSRPRKIRSYTVENQREGSGFAKLLVTYIILRVSFYCWLSFLLTNPFSALYLQGDQHQAPSRMAHRYSAALGMIILSLLFAASSQDEATPDETAPRQQSDRPPIRAVLTNADGTILRQSDGFTEAERGGPSPPSRPSMGQSFAQVDNMPTSTADRRPASHTAVAVAIAPGGGSRGFTHAPPSAIRGSASHFRSPSFLPPAPRPPIGPPSDGEPIAFDQWWDLYKCEFELGELCRPCCSANSLVLQLKKGCKLESTA